MRWFFWIALAVLAIGLCRGQARGQDVKVSSSGGKVVVDTTEPRPGLLARVQAWNAARLERKHTVIVKPMPPATQPSGKAKTITVSVEKK